MLYQASLILSSSTWTTPGLTVPTSTNNGLFERSKTIAESKRIDLQRPIFHDLFSTSRYLINQLDVKIKMYRSATTFCDLTAESNNSRLNIEDIYILVKKIRVNPKIVFGQNTLYPFKKEEVKSVITCFKADRLTNSL